VVSSITISVGGGGLLYWTAHPFFPHTLERKFSAVLSRRGNVTVLENVALHNPRRRQDDDCVVEDCVVCLGRAVLIWVPKISRY